MTGPFVLRDPIIRIDTSNTWTGLQYSKSQDSFEHISPLKSTVGLEWPFPWIGAGGVERTSVPSS